MNKKYCSNCGQLIADKANFCEFCGAPQHGQESRFKIQEPQVDIPIAVTNVPKQARHKHLDYIPKRHLSGTAIMFFYFSMMAKSIILFLLLMAGAALQPWPLVLGPVLYLFTLLIMSLLIYNNFTFEVDSDGLKIEQGVIHRLHVSVPFEQIQNVNIERTITDRILGVARISIETAGQASTPTNGSVTKSRSEAYLPGLHLKEANTIHDLLIDGSDGVMGE